MKEYVNDWEDDLHIIVENAGEVTKWAISQVRPLPQFVDAKVALLGDSAHAMVPYIGAGAGQAIEDAFILGRLLASPLVSRNNVANVLKVYEDIRKPISQDAASRSLKMGYLMELHPDYLPEDADVDKVKAGDHVQLEKVANAMQDVWSFHSTNMPGECWERASEMLVQILEAVPRKDEDDV
ncbi:hypothetical protein QCA50_003561 [Cerrena zonata]|uniref:FAD-binding domain-containing protein n=1 Tax=Cerrena zonata TaxID=2478898 RepID=A0AAW0GMJ8_9APHY